MTSKFRYARAQPCDEWVFRRKARPLLTRCESNRPGNGAGRELVAAYFGNRGDLGAGAADKALIEAWKLSRHDATLDRGIPSLIQPAQFRTDRSVEVLRPALRIPETRCRTPDTLFSYVILLRGTR
jgi:hypothetical protein